MDDKKRRYCRQYYGDGIADQNLSTKRAERNGPNNHTALSRQKHHFSRTFQSWRRNWLSLMPSSSLRSQPQLAGTPCQVETSPACPNGKRNENGVRRSLGRRPLWPLRRGTRPAPGDADRAAAAKSPRAACSPRCFAEAPPATSRPPQGGRDLRWPLVDPVKTALGYKTRLSHLCFPQMARSDGSPRLRDQPCRLGARPVHLARHAP